MEGQCRLDFVLCCFAEAKGGISAFALSGALIAHAHSVACTWSILFNSFCEKPQSHQEGKETVGNIRITKWFSWNR